jgi:flagellar protein FliS
MQNRAFKTYGTQKVMTASPVELVALLYDKAIVSLREAASAIEAGDVNARWKANNKATEIVTHLANTLDHDQGGEVAQNLEKLYRFILDRLFEVDMKNDAQAALDVIGLLEPLRDSWRALAEQAPEAAGPQSGAQSGTQSGAQSGGAAPRPAEGRGQDGAYPATPGPEALREALNISA